MMMCVGVFVYVLASAAHVVDVFTLKGGLTFIQCVQ